jgi:hypothetical protein
MFRLIKPSSVNEIAQDSLLRTNFSKSRAAERPHGCISLLSELWVNTSVEIWIRDPDPEWKKNPYPGSGINILDHVFMFLG